MEENWYERSLNKIADSIGQVKINRISSIKKAMFESFDIKISKEDSKKIMSILQNELSKNEKNIFLKEKIAEIINTDEETLSKIASYFTNFKC